MGKLSALTALFVLSSPLAGGCGDDPVAAGDLSDTGTPDAAEVSDTADTSDAIDTVDTIDAMDTSDTSDTSDTTDTIEPAPPRPDPVVVWESCKFLNADNAQSQCASVTMPLSTRDEKGRTLDVFVKRLRATDEVVATQGHRRALWLLMGGPGQPGADGEGVAAMLAQRDPGLDFYLIDHRGTGRSARLGCAVEESQLSLSGPGIEASEWPSCRATVVSTWGDALQYFSATEAAYDLESLVRMTRAPEDEVFVLGISYGTYLAQRYLQLFPDGAGVDAVALDSICPAVGCHLSDEDLWEDAVAREILDLCPSDPDCSKYYPRNGPTVWEELARLYDEVATGHCPLTDDPELDVYLLRAHLGQLMFNYGGRRLVPAFVRRYLRCSEGDVAAIRRSFIVNLGFDPGALSVASIDLLSRAGPVATEANLSFTWALGVNIIVSELYANPAPSLAELEARNAAALSCRGASLQVGYAAEGWPRYREPLADTWPTFQAPVLAMNADYDPATPARYARTIAPKLTGAHQTYVEIPGHGHTVIAQGQLIDDPTTTCGRELLVQFLADPTATLDTGCLAESLPMQFKMRPQAVQYWFGAADLWDDPKPL